MLFSKHRTYLIRLASGSSLITCKIIQKKSALMSIEVNFSSKLSTELPTKNVSSILLFLLNIKELKQLILSHPEGLK